MSRGGQPQAPPLFFDWYGMDVNPETDLTVTCDATEAMVSALLAIVDLRGTMQWRRSYQVRLLTPTSITLEPV